MPSEPPDGAGLRGSIALTVPSRLADVALAGTAVRAVCQGAGLDEDAAGGMELAVVELLNNIVIHGYGEAGRHTIRLELLADDEAVRVRITDTGRPVPDAALAQRFDFDPADLHALPESGMGLMLVRASVDEFDYRSGPDGNTTTLRKALR